MKKTSIIIIFLIGLYTLLRNNVIQIEGQILWSTSPDIFYEVLLPFIMLLSSFLAFIKKENKKLFYMAFGAMIIDFAMRLSIAINHFYIYLTYKPLLRPEDIETVQTITYNYWARVWPSHIMGLFELTLILLLINSLLQKTKNAKNS